MARRALLAGINDYRGITDLRGCINDVRNMRYILKTYLGFTNNDIRVVLDSRATRQGILARLEYMVNKAKPGDYMVFHFSGHGSQIRDRDGDESLDDGLDELLCPYDMDWNGTFILDDDLDRIFSRIPDGALLEVILDCCHSGTGTRSVGIGGPGGGRSEDGCPEQDRVSRFLQPPEDILFRFEGDEEELGETRGFSSANRSGTRSTGSHILWSGCTSYQTSADAYIDGTYNGAFSYYFCKHMNSTGGDISRANLLERIRASLRNNGYTQTPQLMSKDSRSLNGRPFQYPAADEQRRMLYLTTPYMRGSDVKEVQQALADAGYHISADGVFGPHTREVIKQYQDDNNLMVDGVVGPGVYGALFR